MNKEAAIEITKPLIQKTNDEIITRIPVSYSKNKDKSLNFSNNAKINKSAINVYNTVRFTHLDSRHFLASRIIRTFFTTNIVEVIICLLFMINFCFIVICEKQTNFLIWIVFIMLIKSYVKVL